MGQRHIADATFINLLGWVGIYMYEHVYVYVCTHMYARQGNSRD